LLEQLPHYFSRSLNELVTGYRLNHIVDAAETVSHPPEWHDPILAPQAINADQLLLTEYLLLFLP
jgi:hypothetical protein